jgi:hypothetical protein
LGEHVLSRLFTLGLLSAHPISGKYVAQSLSRTSDINWALVSLYRREKSLKLSDPQINALKKKGKLYAYDAKIELDLAAAFEQAQDAILNIKAIPYDLKSRAAENQKKQPPASLEIAAANGVLDDAARARVNSANRVMAKNVNDLFEFLKNSPKLLANKISVFQLMHVVDVIEKAMIFSAEKYKDLLLDPDVMASSVWKDTLVGVDEHIHLYLKRLVSAYDSLRPIQQEVFDSLSPRAAKKKKPKKKKKAPGSLTHASGAGAPTLATIPSLAATETKEAASSVVSEALRAQQKECAKTEPKAERKEEKKDETKEEQKRETSRKKEVAGEIKIASVSPALKRHGFLFEDSQRVLFLHGMSAENTDCFEKLFAINGQSSDQTINRSSIEKLTTYVKRYLISQSYADAAVADTIKNLNRVSHEPHGDSAYDAYAVAVGIRRWFIYYGFYPLKVDGKKKKGQTVPSIQWLPKPIDEHAVDMHNQRIKDLKKIEAAEADRK